MRPILEICVANLASAINAQKAGANRIELCVNLTEGGETPSLGLIKEVRKQLHIPIHVLIRPRAGDFIYSQQEIDIMCHDIALCHKLKIDGVVIGALTPERHIDVEITQELIKYAQDMSITFHRAIDITANPIKEASKIAHLGVHRILTSGGEQSAWEGRKTIANMVELFQNQFIILAGAGINAENISPLAEATKAQEFHSSGSAFLPAPMPSEPYRKSYFFGGKNQSNENQLKVSDVEIIKTIIEKLHSI